VYFRSYKTKERSTSGNCGRLDAQLHARVRNQCQSESSLWRTKLLKIPLEFRHQWNLRSCFRIARKQAANRNEFTENSAKGPIIRYIEIFNPFRGRPNTAAKLPGVCEIRIHVSRDASRKRALVARAPCDAWSGQPRNIRTIPYYFTSEIVSRNYPPRNFLWANFRQVHFVCARADTGCRTITRWY